VSRLFTVLKFDCLKFSKLAIFKYDYHLNIVSGTPPD